MVQKIKIQTQHFPKIVTDLMLVTILLLAAMILLINRPPEIITFDLNREKFRKRHFPAGPHTKD